MQPSQQGHLGGRRIVLAAPLELSLGGSDLLRRGVGALLDDGQFPNRLVERNIVPVVHRLDADLAKALQVIGVLLIGNDWRVPGGFVNDVRRRGVENMVDGSHVQSDGENAILLQLHKRLGRNEAVHYHRPPAEIPKAGVHFVDGRDALDGNTGARQTFEVNGMRRMPELRNQLTHGVAPHGLITRRVALPVILIGDELS